MTLPYPASTASRDRLAAEVRIFHPLDPLRLNKKMPSGAKALIGICAYGTAEAVPFLQRPSSKKK
jgi:hypothetical protein